jgi:GNAT superfamily N-acetyltransferase
MHEITRADTADEVEMARSLFREYEAWLGLDLCFQGFEAELDELPGLYAPPDGRLYLAYVDGEPSGCIAMRKLEEGICEMKRLYLRESARGSGIGNELISIVLEDAREIGYTKMRLDTYPPKMAKAVVLYESHGFRPTEPYYNNPNPETLFMELELC